MNRVSFLAAARKERRWHPVPKLPPMPPEFQRHYQHALHRYGQTYKTARIRRYKVTKTHTCCIWHLRRWMKNFRERGPLPEIIRHLAYCSAHIAVVDSRNLLPDHGRSCRCLTKPKSFRSGVVFHNVRTPAGGCKPPSLSGKDA